MSSSPATRRLLRRHGSAASTATAMLAAIGLVVLACLPAGAATAAIGLGTAESFAILAGSGITNTGTTTITGDVGSFPTPTITGFGSVVLSGVNHGGDAVTQQAKKDLQTAYDQAFASAPATAVATELGGRTLTPGVYHNGTLGITGALTLDTLGDPEAVFVFQADSTLDTATASSVVVLGSQTACNVFWQVGSSATLGARSSFVGTILAETSITANTGATIEGRLLAQNGAVTLQGNTITARACASSTPTTTTTTTTTTGPGVTTTAPVATTTADATGDLTGDGTTTADATPTADATTTGDGTTTAGAVPPTFSNLPPSDSSRLTELPRTGLSDWLPLAGALAIAVGLLLVRIGTPQVPLRHALVRSATRRRRS